MARDRADDRGDEEALRLWRVLLLNQLFARALEKSGHSEAASILAEMRALVMWDGWLDADYCRRLLEVAVRQMKRGMEAARV